MLVAIAWTLVGAFVLVSVVPVLANVAVYSLGAWRLGYWLTRFARVLHGNKYESLLFGSEIWLLRESGDIDAAVATVHARLAEEYVPALLRNAAIDLLISAGQYRAALRAE